MIDCTKLSAVADAVDCLARRFDALCARKDAAGAPSEYKRLVKARDDAKAALTDLYRRAATGEKGLNFRNLEADYTRASNALAAAQVKMSRGDAA
jgi:hypothetical protein